MNQLLTALTRIKQRLSLRTEDKNDPSKIIQPLLRLLQTQKLDYPSTFRRLTTFRTSLVSDKSRSHDLDTFISSLYSASFEVDKEEAQKEWRAWLIVYAERVEKESGLWKGGEEEREKTARGVNPRFVLRQWVLEEIIKRVQTDPESGKRALAKVHEVCNAFLLLGYLLFSSCWLFSLTDIVDGRQPVQTLGCRRG